MNAKEKAYLTLCVMFSVMIVSGNLVYQKFIELPLFAIHTFELSVGAMFYPLTFLLTDLITEFYGKDKANFCVKLGISMNLLIVAIISLMDGLNATHWSPVDNQTFHRVFGFYSVAFIGSILACYIAQSIDIVLYTWIRRLTGSKWLWLRNNGSTAVSLLIDTSVVIGFMTFFGALPKAHMGTLIWNSYVYKLCFTVLSTPLFYIGVYIMRIIIYRNTAQRKKEYSYSLPQ
ncbi:MAG: queuosine precursor transporter [Alphaproteobacteria bacterium]|nr:queuosine precursor transporter [Alphaproteobacteria bacterium]